MKNLSIVLTLTIVLGMAGCDTDSTSSYNKNGMLPPLTPFSFYKEQVDKALETWTEQGVADYSFDVRGYDFEPYIPFESQPFIPFEVPYPLNIMPTDAKFCAHVTVAGGRIVSIVNIASMPPWGMSYSPDEGLGDYTWGAIPDILGKIVSLSIEDASSPFAYQWSFGYYVDGGFPEVFNLLDLGLYIYSRDPSLYPEDTVLVRMISLDINNFQVTENVP